MPRRKYFSLPSTGIIEDPFTEGVRQFVENVRSGTVQQMQDYYKTLLKQKMLEEELKKSLAIQQEISERRKIPVTPQLQQLIKERTGLEYNIGDEIDVSVIPRLLQKPTEPRPVETPQQKLARDFLSNVSKNYIFYRPLLEKDKEFRNLYEQAHKILGLPLPTIPKDLESKEQPKGKKFDILKVE